MLSEFDGLEVEVVLTCFVVIHTLHAKRNSALNASSSEILCSIAMFFTFTKNSITPIKRPVRHPKRSTRKTPPTLSIPSSAALSFTLSSVFSHFSWKEKNALIKFGNNQK